MPLIAEYKDGALTVIEREYTVRTSRGRREKVEVSRKRNWTIKVWYDTLSGPQELLIKHKKKCYLNQLTPVINEMIDKDETATGGVRNLSWHATGK
jgi:hypothetical protein